MSPPTDRTPQCAAVRGPPSSSANRRMTSISPQTRTYEESTQDQQSLQLKTLDRGRRFTEENSSGLFDRAGCRNAQSRTFALYCRSLQRLAHLDRLETQV